MPSLPSSTILQCSDVEHWCCYYDWNIVEGECSGVDQEWQLSHVHSSTDIDVTIDLALASTFDKRKEGIFLDSFVKDFF